MTPTAPRRLVPLFVLPLLTLLPGAAVAQVIANKLIYVPFPPCRIIDTRLGGGPLAAGQPRSFEVSGTENFAAQGGMEGGCGIPQSNAPTSTSTASSSRCSAARRATSRR